MYCHNCGVQIVVSANFCPNCGAGLQAACPNCGAEASEGDMFCPRCGHDLARPVGGAVRGAVGGAVAGSRAVAGKPFQVSGKLIAAGLGAIAMLVSLAIPWYAFRGTGIFAASADVNVGDLLDAPADWVGWGLPVVLFIVFASIVLLLVLATLVTGKYTGGWWSKLGFLCGLCVLGNAGFVLYQVGVEDDSGSVSLNIAAAGSIVALIGAFIVSISSTFGKGRRAT